MCNLLLQFTNMKDFSKTIFISVTLLLFCLTFISYYGALAEEDGTLNNNSTLIWLARLFNILRFPTHSLLWNLFSQNGTIYIVGLIINCLFYAFIIERAALHLKRFAK